MGEGEVPDVVAVVPARGGSKGIPRKNVRSLAGRPLIWWTLDAATACPQIDAVVVSTDDDEIASVAAAHPSGAVRVVRRSPETATDDATTESALVEFAETSGARDLVLIQATSPLLTAGELSAGIEAYRRGGFDSLLSVVRQRRFVWEAQPDGSAAPQNYDPDARPRRQEFEGFAVENGAFYVFSREGLLRTGSRLFGRIGMSEMGEASYLELDEPHDWDAVDALLRARPRTDLAERLREVRLFITDVDGVLTDAGMYYSERGDELKRFNTRDGKGLALLREAGIQTAILTSEQTDLVAWRGRKLRLDYVRQGATDKIPAFEALLAEAGVAPAEVAYIGDDLNDLPVMERVGVRAAPADAEPAILAVADYVCERSGGRGCVREFASLLLDARS